MRGGSSTSGLARTAGEQLGFCASPPGGMATKAAFLVRSPARHPAVPRRRFQAVRAFPQKLRFGCSPGSCVGSLPVRRLRPVPGGRTPRWPSPFGSNPSRERAARRRAASSTQDALTSLLPWISLRTPLAKAGSHPAVGMGTRPNGWIREYTRRRGCGRKEARFEQGPSMQDRRKRLPDRNGPRVKPAERYRCETQGSIPHTPH